jgi:uncharacterized protein (TIGR03083 family)
MEGFVMKAELLRRLEREYMRFRAVLAALTPQQMTMPATIGNWSVKDVIAHLIAHEQRALQELHAALRGERFEIDHRTNDLFNAQVVAASHSQSLEAVLREWDHSYGQVRAAVEALTEADFDPASPVVRALGDSIDGALGNSTYGHYAEHIERVKAFAEGVKGRQA